MHSAFPTLGWDRDREAQPGTVYLEAAIGQFSVQIRVVGVQVVGLVSDPDNFTDKRRVLVRDHLYDTVVVDTWVTADEHTGTAIAEGIVRGYVLAQDPTAIR